MQPILGKLAADMRVGALSRREFIALATTFGASAAAAYGMLGTATPAHAEGLSPKKGGTLRIAGRVLGIVDPRKFSVSEQGNLARCVCETLIRWEDEATLAPSLLRAWEVSDDAREYRLHLRKDAVWTNGDAFDARDVVHNLKRWCNKAEPGNSMSSSMSAMIDPGTGQAAKGAIKIIDTHTVHLSLRRPDITLLARMVDYPALIVHRDFGEDDSLMEKPIGTGAFEFVSLSIGDKARFKRREDGKWWGGEAYLDAVEFIDYGADATTIAAAFDADEVDANDETASDFVPYFDTLGLAKQVRATSNTLVARMRVDAPPFDNVEFRRAIQLAVDNEAVLSIGLNGDGVVGENHHMSPMQPEYADLPRIAPDPARAIASAQEAGLADAAIELTSIDGDWRATTSDAIASQIRQAGFKIRRRVVAGASFWNAWTEYPFSTTAWGGRPLGIQVYSLAYKSNQPWNETGFSDPEFDALLDEAVGLIDTRERREVCKKMQKILQDSGIIIQPFWRNQTMHHRKSVHNYGRFKTRELHLEKVWMST